jgi:hypothetical protein
MWIYASCYEAWMTMTCGFSVSTVAAHKAGEVSITSSLGLLALRVSWRGVPPRPVTRFVTRSGVD